jgi:pyruvate dehydrogenase E2 component (dihydrolipoamide acetyltransferase)
VQLAAARRLSESKQQTPHFYLALEARVDRLDSLRAQLREGAGGVRLTVTHFILAAVARVLREMPEANRVWRDESLVEFSQADVGLAVDTPRGLMAPLLRDIGGLRIGELARRADRIAERARSGALSPDDFGGGSITVSNAGMHNVTYMTSIINPGQAMILGAGSIRDVYRPDPAGQPKAARELGLVLSVDHRVTDGVGALRFLNRVVDLLQRPARLLLD